MSGLTTVTALRPVSDSGQTITTGAASARTTNPVSSGIRSVRIYASADCYIRIGGASEAATANDEWWPAGLLEYKPINPGEYIHAIQATASGTVNVSEETR